MAQLLTPIAKCGWGVLLPTGDGPPSPKSVQALETAWEQPHIHHTSASLCAPLCKQSIRERANTLVNISVIILYFYISVVLYFYISIFYISIFRYSIFLYSIFLYFYVSIFLYLYILYFYIENVGKRFPGCLPPNLRIIYFYDPLTLTSFLYFWLPLLNYIVHLLRLHPCLCESMEDPP